LEAVPGRGKGCSASEKRHESQKFKTEKKRITKRASSLTICEKKERRGRSRLQKSEKALRRTDGERRK